MFTEYTACKKATDNKMGPCADTKTHKDEHIAYIWYTSVHSPHTQAADQTDNLETTNKVSLFYRM